MSRSSVTSIRPEEPARQRRLPPGPPARTLLACTREMQRRPLEYMLDLTRQYGDVLRVMLIFGNLYIVNHPDGIKHILQENNRNYNKEVLDYKMLRIFLGKGLLTDDGDSWLHQRRLMQPAFHRQRLASFGTLVTDAALAMLDRWQSIAEQGSSLDVAAEMMRLTQRIVGRALFNIDLSAETNTVGQAFTTANRFLSDYLYVPFPPLFFPSPRNLRFREAGRTLDKVVIDIIQERRRQNTDTGDLLSMLLLARDEETGEGMNDRQLRDNVLTLLLAGHETTSNALSWTWYLLAQHPDIAQKLHAELDTVLAGRTPTVDDLPNLPYNRMVIEEALRLYPPAWAFTRNAVADDEIGGYRIPAGSMILLCPYTTHRHPEFWENPEMFDPERFTPERSANRPRYAYFPFGGGPRQCIGNNFALMEAQLILATISQRYQLHLAADARVEFDPLITLRPRHGLSMTLHSPE